MLSCHWVLCELNLLFRPQCDDVLDRISQDLDYLLNRKCAAADPDPPGPDGVDPDDHEKRRQCDALLGGVTAAQKRTKL